MYVCLVYPTTVTVTNWVYTWLTSTSRRNRHTSRILRLYGAWSNYNNTLTTTYHTSQTTGYSPTYWYVTIVTALLLQQPQQPAMWNIMSTCFLTVKDKLDNRLGFFELLGFDFMLDDSLKVSVNIIKLLPPWLLQLWLIESNVNPALHTTAVTLQQVIPLMLQETIGKACW